MNALHQMGGEAGNLVSKSLGLDHCNMVDDSLVDVEVLGQSEIKRDVSSDTNQSETYLP